MGKIILFIVYILVMIGMCFMLSMEFKDAAKRYNEKDYVGFGNSMVWVIIFSTSIIKAVCAF